MEGYEYEYEDVRTPAGLLRLYWRLDEIIAADFVGGAETFRHSVIGRGGSLHRSLLPSEVASAFESYERGEFCALGQLRVAPDGTPFDKLVWSALRGIQPGTTLSYGALATLIGRERGARAVGLANGRNPVPVIIPCHRVVGADGSLTGYGSGIARKQALLQHEGAWPAALL